MPLIALQVQAELTNLASLRAPPTYPWHLTIKCTSCGETTPSSKPVVISSDSIVEGIRGGDVTARLKCKLCGRINTVLLLPGEHVYGVRGGGDAADGDDDAVAGEVVEGGVGAAPRRPGWSTFASFDCRGVELVAWVVADDVPFEAVAGGGGAPVEGGALIDDGEWYGYDEGVAVTEWEYRFVKVK
ncbi:hypothetical protein MMPV_006282 [Pyropia vietnamensis]